MPNDSCFVPRPGLRLASLLALAVAGCAGPSIDESRDATLRAADSDEPGDDSSGAYVTPIESLPTLAADEAIDAWVQQLSEPTPQGDNVAVHLRLPPPLDPTLASSLVRVFEGDASLLLFRTDALVELGMLDSSPGPDVFTALMSLDLAELEQRLQTEQALAAGDDVTELKLHFQGRTPVALTSGVAFDLTAFNAGSAVSLGPCPFTPTSTIARWEESLMITDPAVVQDPTRTRDVCGVGGDRDGVWTFKHLMGQMALGSGMSTNEFVEQWLSEWLNDHTINGDLVPDRIHLFDDVIVPWAAVSGATVQLTNVGGTKVIQVLSGQLDLDDNPFRLAAIVNRIDLQSGADPYGGSSTAQPLDGGELRFVFLVQDVQTCSAHRFSVILEYGVPISGCEDVRQWAEDWTVLNDAAALPRFSSAWLSHLETLTESVVLSGAAPGRGNDSAINQVRTNEFLAVSPEWELREFTLSTEDLSSTDTVPPGTPDTPSTGQLIPHTVAMTPDDAAHLPTGPSLEVDDFVQSFVVPTVSGTGLPGDCAASFVVPPVHPSFGVTFKGGNSISPLGSHWTANVGTSAVEICGRHQLSLNTCNGCHTGDTATQFFHVDPTTMPATLSDFLTGGGGIFNVPDTQFSGTVWSFAELDRRFQRLYELACTSCTDGARLAPSALQTIASIAGVVPLDSHGTLELPFETGPITELEVVAQLLEARGDLLGAQPPRSLELHHLTRPVQTFVH